MFLLEFLRKTNLKIPNLKPAECSDISGVGNEHHAILGKYEIPILVSGIKISFDFYVLENYTIQQLLEWTFYNIIKSILTFKKEIYLFRRELYV